MKRSGLFAFGFLSLLCFVLACSFAVPCAASTAVKVTPSGDGIELEYVGEDGTKGTTTIPLHKAGDVRYFSAGVGVEERAAKYPAFPLKLIFVAGPKAYLSQVAVTITDAKGAVQLQVPGEQVTGPWLYVDLPAGTYAVDASREGQAHVKGQVTVTKGGVKTLYLRWKENTP